MADGRIVIETAIDNTGAERGIVALQSRLQGLGSNLQQIGSSIATAVTLPLVAVGGAAMKTASDFDSAQRKMQKSLGVTADQAKALSNTAIDLWADGFGESLDDVSNSLINVKQNMRTVADGDELKRVTRDAMLLAETFDSDINEVTRAGNNLMVNFGISSKKAFDLMAYGAQNGLNFSQEMFDNLSEYGPLFADMGYSADEYFQLLVNGARAGVYNLDYVNDSFKEFQIRLKDGSKATSDAFALLSEDSNKVWQSFLKGDATVKDVANTVLAELKAMDDQVLANQIGVGLWGTKWEDLEADAMYALGGIDGELKNVEGSMSKIAEVQEQSLDQQFRSVLRETQVALEPIGRILLDLVQSVLPHVSSGIQQLSKWLNNLSPAGQGFVVAIGLISAALPPLMVLLGLIVSSVGALIGAFAGVSASVVGVVSGVGLLVTALVTAYAQSETFRNGVSEVFSAIKNIAVNVFQAVASFIGQKISEIKSFWLSNGTQILKAVEKVFKGIKSVISAAMPAVQFIIEMVWTAIKQVISGALNVIMGLVKTFSGLMTGDFSKMWEGIKQIFSGAIDLIIGWMTLTFVGGLRTLITNLAKSAFNLIKGMWDDIARVFTNMGATVNSIASKIVNSVLNFFRGLSTNAINTFSTLRTLGASIWNSISQTIIGIVRNIASMVKQYFSDLWSSVRNSMHNVKSTVVNIWNEVMGFFKGINLYQIGREIIQGLINGIGSMASAVWDKAKSIANSVVDSVKGALNIQSPSRVFIQIGIDTIQGLINGIKEKAPDLNNAMDTVISTVVEKGEELISKGKSIGKSFLDALISPVTRNGVTYSNSYVADTALPGSSSNTLVKGPDGKYYTWEDYNDKFQSGKSSGSSSNKSSGSSKTVGDVVKDAVNKVKDSIGKIFKFHDGGYVGKRGNIRFDEVMALLKKGEYVLSEDDVKNIANLSVPSIYSLYTGIGNGLNQPISNHHSSKVDNSRKSFVTVNAGLGAREIANETEKALNRLAFRMG